MVECCLYRVISITFMLIPYHLMIFVTYWFIVWNMNSWHSIDFHTDGSNIFEMIWEIYIRLDFNTTRYTRHKLHLLTLTIHPYLNCSYHTFIYYTFESCVIRSWSIQGIKKYISNKNSYHNSLQSPLLVASVMDLKWAIVCGFQNYSLSFIV